MSVSKAVTIAKKGLTFDIVRKSRLFPTIQVLNSFFQCGVDDADSEVAIHWEPFVLSQSEYYEFFDACQNSIGELTIDGLGSDEYEEWVSAVAIRRNSG